MVDYIIILSINFLYPIPMKLLTKLLAINMVPQR